MKNPNNLTPNPLSSSHGFTLLEIIVSTSVFSVAMLVAVGLFVSVTQVQKRTQSLSKVQGDARFALELMAQSVRVDGLDYGYFRDHNSDGVPSYPVNLVSQSTDELVTKAADGTRQVYRLYNNTIVICERTVSELNAKCSRGNEGNASSFQTVTPSNVAINSFKVWINPASDPFTRPRSDSECQNMNFDETKGICTCTAANVASHCGLSQTCDESAGSPGFCALANEQPRVTIMIKSKGGSGREQEKAEVTFQTTVASRIYQR